MTYPDVNIQNEIVKKINVALSELAETWKRDKNNCYWIFFTLESREYAIDAEHVERVDVLRELVPYVDVPDYCPGVTWDRGGMIRLLDLRAVFGQGDYRSAVKKDNNWLPMIVIIEPDGKRRGMIVDKIVMFGHASAAIEPLTSEGTELPRGVQGMLKYDANKAPAFVIGPESFNWLELEKQNTKVDWKGRIDIKMSADDLRSN